MSKIVRIAISFGAVVAFVLAGFAVTASGAGVHQHAKVKGTVAFLGPETFTGRWIKDAKYFNQELHRLDSKIKILDYNANTNINTQTQQAQTAIAKGAKVLILAAVDQNEDAPIVNNAERQGVKVLAYDRIIQTDKLRAYDSFNNVQVGKEQGGWLNKNCKKGSTVVEIRGSSTDHNAFLFYKGYQIRTASKFKKGTWKLGYSVQTPNWNPPTAGQEMDAALAKLHNKVNCVYSMNDGMAKPVQAALARVHLKIPLTGQDAQPDGLGRILIHTQGMTVFKNVKFEALAAADVAYNWLAGKGLPKEYKKNCGIGCALADGKHVPAVLFKPESITLKNVADPVKAGFDTWGGSGGVCATIGKHTSKPYCGLKH
ncbi:MAG TPA: substrate-binding domain-containing protein [Chloroflexota bacterium]|nr:substrate-binding domain-containing protein [Chloroflexota bacterium]